MKTKSKSDSDNICCPNLKIADCTETNEHCHLVCGYSNTPLTNKTVKELCIGHNFSNCINMKMEAS